MFNSLSFATLLLSLVGGIHAWARSDADIQSAIESALEQRHPTDTADWWRALGPNAPAVIERMYGSSSQTYHRIRLIQGLGWFDSADVRQFLKATASQATDDVIRNAAIRGVGTSGAVGEEEWIAGFLSHADVQTRYAAAETLQKLGTPSALEKVKRYLAAEPAPWIAGKLQGQLPRGLAPIAPTASSEDRPSPDWVGSWEGYWIDPSAKAPKKVRVSIDTDGPQSWKAKLVLGNASVPQVIEWRASQVRGTRAQGEYRDAQGKARAFSAQLSVEAQHFVLRAQIPSAAHSLVVWRTAH